MLSERSSHSGQRNDDCMHMHTVLEIEVHRSLNGYAWFQWLGIAGLLCQLIALFVAVFSYLELSRFSLPKLLLMEIGTHNLFSDMSFSCANIQVSQK